MTFTFATDTVATTEIRNFVSMNGWMHFQRGLLHVQLRGTSGRVFASRKIRNWLLWKTLIAIHFNCVHADITVDYKMAKRLFGFSLVVQCNWCFQLNRQLSDTAGGCGCECEFRRRERIANAPLSTSGTIHQVTDCSQKSFFLLSTHTAINQSTFKIFFISACVLSITARLFLTARSSISKQSLRPCLPKQRKHPRFC